MSDFIKELRKKHNLTQKELADKYNVTCQAVSKWENERSMPDLQLLKQISKDFDVSLDNILDGVFDVRKRNIKRIIIISIILIILVLLFIFIYNNKSTFKFKTLSSKCDNFTISGSIAYDEKKSSIYIDNVTYCGGNDTNSYKNIECSLYEVSGNYQKTISSCNNKNNKNITLEKFLEDISFVVDDYTRVCKEYSSNNLFIKIDATDNNDKITSYEIPLKIENTCDK